MPARLVTSVLVGRRVLPAGTEETPELRRQIRKADLWSGPSELSDDELQPAVPPSAESDEATAGDVDGTVGEAIGAAVAVAKDELREELRLELRELVEQLVATIEPAVVEHQDDGQPAGGTAELAEPPRGGKGSGEPEWRVYADKLGIDVSGVSDRDGIIALVDQHKATSR